jgi:hypothetical protein
MTLPHFRQELNQILDPRYGADFAKVVRSDWTRAEFLVTSWWKAYKQWEARDTFEAAYQDRRMTVRTFGADWGYQRDKTLRDLTVPNNRFFGDGRYTPLKQGEQRDHGDAFHKPDERAKYFANRGVDSSAYGQPQNFSDRMTKYALGLHDLSASLVNPRFSLFDQIHNGEDGAHFAFVPLSHQEDQVVLYDLIRHAKALRSDKPALYELVHGYRAEMTRVKLAQEFDLGVGYVAMPIENPTNGHPKFRLRYGLGNTTTALTKEGQKSLKVTPEVYQARQQAAVAFKSILDIRDAKNEIVVAFRKHAAGFPLYAERDGNLLRVFNIGGTAKQRTGQTISSRGALT